MGEKYGNGVLLGWRDSELPVTLQKLSQLGENITKLTNNPAPPTGVEYFLLDNTAKDSYKDSVSSVGATVTGIGLKYSTNSGSEDNMGSTLIGSYDKETDGSALVYQGRKDAVKKT